ncbi:hypothetical protein [Paratractidigestivibacter sp.]|uniref:hypothetical protein n=1 Tax=Paratractidigestivibacter sp. TaxID=2847316 RepID=UPI002ABE5C76|nr:hypothetical protein [Paratractidigestivibacter sp.]
MELALRAFSFEGVDAPPACRAIVGAALVVAGAAAVTWRACFLDGAALSGWARASLVFLQVDVTFYGACASARSWACRLCGR